MDWFYIVPTVSALFLTGGWAIYARSRKLATSQWVVCFVQNFFAVHLIFSSLRFFLSTSQPVITHPIAGPFIASLTAMGIFPGIKALEFVVGTMLLARIFVPLALVLEFPPTLTIFYMNTFITGYPRELVTGPLELFLNGVLMFAYFEYYRSMLAIRAKPASPIAAFVQNEKPETSLRA